MTGQETMIEADRAEVIVLVENWIDMLLPDLDRGEVVGGGCVTRTGLIEHFDQKRIPPQAENGISLLVRVEKGRHTTTVLFDVGLTGTVLTHNFKALHLDPLSVDHVIISHGHPDHYGGIFRYLAEVDRPMPVVTHPDAFLPRYAVMGDGRTSAFYNATFNEATLSKKGGRIVQTRDAVDLGWGVYTTGEIARTVGFEGPKPPAVFGSPGLYQVSRDGHFVMDEVWDEQGLVIAVKGHGLVVLTGCAHAGVVNTIHRARAICGEDRICAVMGGFHLGFPTTPVENVGQTISALRDLDVVTVVPMHCSGLRSHVAISHDLPDRYVQPAVGTRFRFG